MRQDGFHEVATLIHPISVADQVLVTIRATAAGGGAGVLAERVRVACPGFPSLAGRANLASQAAHDWLDAWAAFAPGRHALVEVSIHIEKRIPVAAGLGGGSADAAAVLLALQEWDPLPWAALHRVAAGLGSDVPYFVAGGPAVCRGRGEIVLPLGSALGLTVLLGVPPFGVRAVDAYRWWDEDGGGARPPSALLQSLEDGPGLVQGGFALGELVHNDLTAAVARRHPLVACMIDALLAGGALAAEMTGSGSAVFGLFADATDGMAALLRDLANRFPAVVWQNALLAGGPCGHGQGTQVSLGEAGEG